MSSSPRYDVASLGELVVDLVPVRGADGQRCYAPKAGGAPGNVAVGVARLGRRAAMLSKVGDEAFGRLLLEALEQDGVATEGVVRSREGNTALAVVTVALDGDRDFIFYREGGADSRYTPDEMASGIVRAARVLHVGSLFLASPLPAAAQRHAIAVAKAAGVTLSADVNLRPSLWRDPQDMRRAALETIAAAEILKVSDEELTFLSGTSDAPAAVARLWHDRLRVVAVTSGSGGAELFTPAHCVAVSGFAVTVVDTVGCGDAFMACLLADLTQSGFALGSEPELALLARRACAAGAIAAMGAGAMESLPTADGLAAFLASHPA